MANTITVTFPSFRELRLNQWRFVQAQVFESTVFKTITGGLIAGLLAGVLRFPFGKLGFENFVALVFLSSALATALHSKSFKKSIFAAALGLGAALVYDIYDNQWPWFADGLRGLVLAPILSHKKSIPQLIITGTVTGLSIFAGLYVGHVMYSQSALAGVMPQTLAFSIYGGVLGLFMGLGCSAQHFRRAHNQVEEKFAKIIERTQDQEVRPLLTRTQELYRVIKLELNQDSDEQLMGIQTRVESLVHCIFELSDRSLSLQNDLDSQNAAELQERISSLKNKAATVKDLTAQKTLNDAVRNLEEQHQALSNITTNHERILARIHAKVALLERLRFALLQLRSANMQHSDDDSSELKVCLEALSQEIEATCKAVDEVYNTSIDLEPKAPILNETKIVEDAVAPETMIFRKTA